MRRKVKIEDLPFSKAKQIRDRLDIGKEDTAEKLKAMPKKKIKMATNVVYCGGSGPRDFRRGWLEIGGKRCYMRSAWERNVARYYQWLKDQGGLFLSIHTMNHSLLHF